MSRFIRGTGPTCYSHTNITNYCGTKIYDCLFCICTWDMGMFPGCGLHKGWPGNSSLKRFGDIHSTGSKLWGIRSPPGVFGLPLALASMGRDDGCWCQQLLAGHRFLSPAVHREACFCISIFCCTSLQQYTGKAACMSGPRLLISKQRTALRQGGKTQYEINARERSVWRGSRLLFLWEGGRGKHSNKTQITVLPLTVCEG